MYIQEVKAVKGRKSRKQFDNGCVTFNERKNWNYTKERLAVGDPEFTKYLEPKPRDYLHH